MQADIPLCTDLRDNLTSSLLGLETTWLSLRFPTRRAEALATMRRLRDTLAGHVALLVAGANTTPEDRKRGEALLALVSTNNPKED